MKFESSEFMKMIGKQDIVQYCEKEDIFARFNEIIEVNEVPENLRDLEFVHGIVMDAFLYGTTRGIKRERCRRNGKEE